MYSNKKENHMIPLCQVPDCCNKAQNIKSNASPYYRRSKWVREAYDVSPGFVCGKHHTRNVAKNRGLPNMAEVVAVNAGFANLAEHQLFQAKENGWDTWTEFQNSLNLIKAKENGWDTWTQFQNSLHAYRWYLNEQPTCENVDSRLGFKCTTTTFPGLGMLDVDHIDGIPIHNHRDNLQTLCKCCHAYKTHMYKDYATPGRKALGVKY